MRINKKAVIICNNILKEKILYSIKHLKNYNFFFSGDDEVLSIYLLLALLPIPTNSLKLIQGKKLSKKELSQSFLCVSEVQNCIYCSMISLFNIY